ncbi:MAG: hypothetical protein AMK75_01820 [Planctomycetes bacterium SM23_65]|nr:MAG: hypothetical protein AMK75_01820 [Planctomycetes bacterium SM23_65]
MWPCVISGLFVTLLATGGLVIATGTAGPPDAASVDEYQRRRNGLAKDLAEQHYALGQWCKERKLSREAQEHFKQAQRFQPDHNGANKELGKSGGKVASRKRVECELRLTDGICVKAELLAEAFCVDTGSGVLFMPVTAVDVVVVGKDEQPDVIAADGFLGRSRVREDSFAAKAKVGVVNVKRANLDQIRVFRPCAVCGGSGNQPCARCEGKGRLYETVPCKQCGGTGKVQCTRCGGTGRLTCPRCDGSGWTPGLIGGFRFKCTRCNGRGTIDCPGCKKGQAKCPVCKGKPLVKDMGVCPVCEGKKEVPCVACGGTGVKPLSPDVEKEVKKLSESTLNKVAE